jgi:hypothetical protein
VAANKYAEPAHCETCHADIAATVHKTGTPGKPYYHEVSNTYIAMIVPGKRAPMALKQTSTGSRSITSSAAGQSKAILAQSSYLPVNDRRLHFGLGAETKADLEITWPNGSRQTVQGVAADQLAVIREPNKDGKGGGIIGTDAFRR